MNFEQNVAPSWHLVASSLTLTSIFSLAFALALQFFGFSYVLPTISHMHAHMRICLPCGFMISYSIVLIKTIIYAYQLSLGCLGCRMRAYAYVFWMHYFLLFSSYSLIRFCFICVSLKFSFVTIINFFVIFSSFLQSYQILNLNWIS